MIYILFLNHLNACGYLAELHLFYSLELQIIRFYVVFNKIANKLVKFQNWFSDQ